MDALPPPEPQDHTLLLNRSTYWHIVHELVPSLPQPAEDTPEAHMHRNRAAISAVASMLPANGDEIRIAARCVAADACAMEAMRLASQHADDWAKVLQCNAQAASMMRQANAARSLLLRVQAVRRKREDDSASLNQDTMTEFAITGLMADALGVTTAPEPPPPPPAPEPADKFRQLTEAEQYAVNYPRRAALIRSLGGLPEPCKFGPPPPDLVHAIVTSTSPILRELDRQPDIATA